MNRKRSRLGLVLGTLILAAWLALHVSGLFLIGLERPWLVALLVVLQTWLSVGLYIVAHDAMHGSLVPGNRRANDWFGAAAVGLYAGFRWRPLVSMHHAHHRHAGTAQDPDFAASQPGPLLPWYLRFMRTYFGWRESLTMLLRVWACVLLGAHPLNVVLFFAVPGLLSSFQLFYFGTYLPHRHQEGHAFDDRHRARSSDYGYLASLLSCFHFGYHHEHHRRPDVPWWGLPALRRTTLTRNDP